MAKESQANEGVQESTADSEAYTKERLEAGRQHLQESQERAKVQFQFLGEPEPEVDIPAPEDRPLDWDSMTDDEKAALERQNEIASDSYEPKDLETFRSETFDSEGVNPEARQFQLREPDEFTGPEAAETAYRTGFNPRTVATSSNPDDLVRVGTESDETAEERVEEVTGRSADSIREEQGGVADGEEVDEDKGSGADETAPKRRRNKKSEE